MVPTSVRSARTARPDVDPDAITRAPWSQVGPEFLRAWGYPKGRRMPQHVAIYGQNGSGKSVFEKTILLERARARGSHIVFIATKPADGEIASIGWPVITKWPPSYKQHQVIFWPKARGIGKAARVEQANAIGTLLNQLWRPDSNIIVVFDEVAYVEGGLGLKLEVENYYRQGRSLGITIVATTQRPAMVSRFMHSESTWSVYFAPKDEQDAERMAETAGSKRLYKPILESLNRDNYEFLLVNNRTREMVISWIDRMPKKAAR